MRRDKSFSRALHALLHLADSQEPMTSEQLAVAMRSNAVVVRRFLSDMRDAGFLSAEKGHGGGWTLKRKLAELTMLDVYEAVGRPMVFAIEPPELSPDCLVERAVNSRLEAALSETETILLRRFAEVRLSDLAGDVGTLSGVASRPKRKTTQKG